MWENPLTVSYVYKNKAFLTWLVLLQNVLFCMRFDFRGVRTEVKAMLDM